MDNFGISVKSFIVKDNKVLLIKRDKNDSFKADRWEIPGGRLEHGEDPFVGLKRETAEEVGLNIEILCPLDIQHLTREDDGQKITMIIFLCKPLSSEIILSPEHQEYKWTDINGSPEFFPEWLLPVIKNFNKITL